MDEQNKDSKYQVWWEDEKIISVKKEINNLIWMNSPGNITLDEAERRACVILSILQEGS